MSVSTKDGGHEATVLHNPSVDHEAIDVDHPTASSLAPSWSGAHEAPGMRLACLPAGLTAREKSSRSVWGWMD